MFTTGPRQHYKTLIGSLHYYVAMQKMQL